MKKIWFITGASRGLGLAIAKAALEAGNIVVATARNKQKIEEQFGNAPNVHALSLDVTDKECVESAVKEAVNRFGGIDVLVNNAGYGLLGWFENMTDEQIRSLYETNGFGVMNVTRAILPGMRERKSGHIFTITSVSGIFSVAGGAIYASSKFAVEGLMEGLAQEVKPLGISSTIIEPGFFKTDFLDSSSVKYSEKNIPDYATQFKAFREWHENMNHKQVGDPAKLGALLVKLSTMPEPPVRIAAGSDGVGAVLEKAQNLRSEAERNRSLSESTDGESDTKISSMTEIGR